MTIRSPKPHPKTATISRRLRSRADQNLSVQPSELPQLRGLRTRPAPTRSVSSQRHISVDYQTDETDTLASIWNPPEVHDTFTRSNTSHPSGLEEPPSSCLLLSQPLALSPFHSPHPSPAGLVPISTQPEPEHYEVHPPPGSDLIPSPLPSLSSCHTAADYDLRLSTEPEQPHDTSVEIQDMSTLGFMMPAHYPSMGHYGSPPSLDCSSYSPLDAATYSEARTSQPPTSAAYAPSYSSGRATEPRKIEHNALPPYQPAPISRSPYQQPLGSLRSSPTPMTYPATSSEASPMLSSAPHSYPYPAIHSSLPAQNLTPLGSNSSTYPPPPIYPPTSYEISGYNPLPTTMYSTSTTAATYSSYESAGLAPHGSPVPGLSSSPGSQSNGVMPRVLNSRPKPQCWEHGCNGRQFSTFSNLLRHQREKSGTAAKSYCPKCGAEFTRTTARNGHMAHDKCKQRRTSDSSR